MVDSLNSDPTEQDVAFVSSSLLDEKSLRSSGKIAAVSYSVIGKNYHSPCLSEIARYGGYSVYSGRQNTDPWVRATLKNFSRDVYDQIYGFTRQPEGVIGMYKSLLKFSDGKSEFDSLSRVQRRAMIGAISKAKKAFKLPYKSEPLDWHDIGQHFRRDTSAGVTFMGRKKGEVMKEIYHEARWLGHRLKQNGKGRFDARKMRFPPCLAGQRGAMSDRDDPKTRLVWVYPAEMLVVEGQYAPVMYRKFMEQPDTPMLNGRSSQRLFTEWLVGHREGEVLYGLDFKSFDTKVPSWLIRVAFDILRQNIEFETWNGKPVSKRDRQKWRNVWDGMVWYFINTPILMPDGRMFRKRRGVPSGSWWTQMVDSVVNYILVEYLTECQEIEARGLRVLGDDSAFRTPDQFDLDVAASDCEPTGMVLSVEKCEKTVDPTDFKLLGTTYRDGHAHRETNEWFKLALYPESRVGNLSVSMSRLIGLWIGGAMWDKEFCSYMDYYQSSYPCPTEGWFTKDQRRWLSIVYGGKAPMGWGQKHSLFWRSIFYTF